jgi:hypothetical protein
MMAPHELEAALSGHRGNGECKPVVISKCAHGADAVLHPLPCGPSPEPTPTPTLTLI